VIAGNICGIATGYTIVIVRQHCVIDYLMWQPFFNQKGKIESLDTSQALISFSSTDKIELMIFSDVVTY